MALQFQVPNYQQTPLPDIRNALAPISEGIDTYRQGINDQFKGQMEQKRLDLAKNADSRAAESHSMEMQKAKVGQIAGLAQMADNEKDPTRRSAIMNAIYQRHPDLVPHLQKEGWDPTDHVNVPKMLIAEARGFVDPLAEKMKQAQINNLNRREEPEIIRQLRAAGVDPQSEQGRNLIMNSIKGGDPISQSIGDAIRKQFQPSQDQPQSPIQPQSFAPQAGQGDPQLIQAQTATVPSPPQQPMVKVPALGEMPKSKAEMLAFGLSMQGKGEAGKMIMEGVNATKLGKEAGNKNDETELQLTDAQARMRQIKSSFDPKFLSMGTQGKMAWNQLISKATGGQLAPKDQEELYRFATFRRDAAENLNIFLKDRSGAAVTEQELKRAQVELPNAGTGIFDGDDPVTFKAKMDRATEVGTLGIARRRMLRDKGFNGAPWDSGISLDQMRGMINARAKQIEIQVRSQNPGLAKPILDREVDARVKQEFGI